MKRLGWAAMAVVWGVAAADGQTKPWTDAVKLKGDVRYRFEGGDRGSTEDARYRNLLSLRLGAEAALSEEFLAAVQLSTGGDDPVSTYQTLGESFTGESVRWNLGYLSWVPADTGLTLQGGKINKPFICVQDLVWDGDLNPEGLGANYALKGDAADLLLNGGYLWTVERADRDDTMLYAGQAAVRLKLPDVATFTVGGSCYVFENIEGEGMLYDDRSFGNSTVAARAGDRTAEKDEPGLRFATGFEEIEGFAEAAFDVLIPVTLYGQYVRNAAADDRNTGWLAGVTVGRARAVHSYEIGYNYRVLEQDAVVGTFTDSDFIGGGTNGEGHKFYAKYQLMKSLQLAAAWFANTLDPDGKSGDYDRWQLDLVARF